MTGRRRRRKKKTSSISARPFFFLNCCNSRKKNCRIGTNVGECAFNYIFRSHYLKSSYYFIEPPSLSCCCCCCCSLCSQFSGDSYVRSCPQSVSQSLGCSFDSTKGRRRRRKRRTSREFVSNKMPDFCFCPSSPLTD